MFLMNTLTVPKIKDLVNKPNEQYRDIYELLQKPGRASTSMGTSMDTSMGTSMGGAGTSASMGGAGTSGAGTMAEELSLFLNELKKSPQGQAQSQAQGQAQGQAQTQGQAQGQGQRGQAQANRENDFYAANEMTGNGFSTY